MRRPSLKYTSLVAIPLLVLAACNTQPSEARADVEQNGSAPQVVASRAVSDFSIYELGGDWRGHDDAERSLESLAGRPQVLAMVYTNCTATCPITVAQMQRIEREAHGNIGMVLISLDPQRDDPERLAAYAGERELDADRWTLLTAPDDDVRAMAAALGVRYRKVSPDEIAHSNILTVLDEEGRIVHQQMGFSNVEETVAALDRRWR